MTGQSSRHAPRAVSGGGTRSVPTTVTGHVDKSLRDSRSRLGETRPRAATGLLVSVRSAAEALVALHAGVDLLDVKEPTRGPLGRADWRVIAEVARCAAGRVPLSAALGELRDEGDPTAVPTTWPRLSETRPRVSERLDHVPQSIAFAKLGLAGCGRWTDWPGRWAAAMARLPAGVVPVAVAYADWRLCDAPSPEDVLAEGSRLGCGAALLDTCEKRAGGLFDHCRDGEVAEWISHARRLGMLALIAGSLTVETAGRAAALGSDYIAVRGAACRGGRAGELDAECIAELRGQLVGCQSSLVRCD